MGRWAEIETLRSALRQIANTSSGGCRGIGAERIERMRRIAEIALGEPRSTEVDFTDASEGPDHKFSIGR